MSDSYLTIQSSTEGLYKEKGSKFIAISFRVYNEEEIKQNLEDLRKKYYDARHHCYAYILGKNQEKYRANDDGEPGNSAGMPILGQIRSKGLTNVLVVVIRYFGGTKLGVSGLINAYKTATAEALAQAEIIEEFILKKIQISFEYPEMNEVMKVSKNYELDFGEQSFDEKCHIIFLVREGIFEEVQSKLKDIESLVLTELN